MGYTNGGSVFISSKNKKEYQALFELKNSEMTASEAYQNGGHIYAEQAMLDLTEVTFNDGVLTRYKSTLGGTIYSKDAHIVAKKVDFGTSIGGTGGCIYASKSNLTMSNIKFHDCQATSVGGAVYATDKTILTTQAPLNKFYENKAESGAGLYVTMQSDVHLDQVEFQNNKASGDWGGDGAAIFIQRASVNIENSKLISNEAQSAGGAVYVDSRGTLTSKQGNVKWTTNDAPRGGAMMIGRYATVNVWKHQFLLNTAIEAGAAVASSSNKKTKKRGYPIIMTECDFHNNSVSLPDSDFVGAETYGGGMDLNRASAKLIKCKFKGNTAEVGGGLSIRGRNCELTLEGTVFEMNVAAEGGGVYGTGKSIVHVHGNTRF